jgi:hypothetical protein
MEPGQVLVVLLYVWLLVALGVYAWRAYRRIVHNETRKDRVARQGEGLPAEDPFTAATSTSTPSTAPEGTEPAGEPAAAEAPSDRRGVFAARAAPDERAGARPTVAELVEGISLPCGLTPVVAGDIDPHRVTFTTSGHQPGEVGSALADELERLGYTLFSESDTEAVARRGEAVLHVRIDPGAEPGGEVRATRKAALTGPTRVIAELST